ncbi:MAG: rRNA maturation RNase YbeY [Caulobacteraceae bacterium]
MIEVVVEDEAWTAALPEAEDWTVRASDAVLKAGRAFALTGETAAPLDVTILLTDDESSAELNGRFLGKTGPTNVLSFPAPETARPHLGDIALAFGVCAREAAAQNKSLSHHLAHLTVHGVLHLLGWDHLTDAEADAMEGLEREILASFHIPDPYLGDRDHG